MNTTPGLDSPFRATWAVAGTQKGLLTCVSISPGALWIASGSQDSTLLFVNFKSGAPVGVLDFESNFHAMSTAWRSDNELVVGCSNGMVYHIDYNPESASPITVRSLLNPMPHPVRELVLDDFRGILGVGCGSDVYVYARSENSSKETWSCIDHIPEPCRGPPGLVTGLSFFGSHLTHRSLLITHAMAGWK
ncbi:hypothetical protein FS749_008554 [Ceratobasidium sp. UAMH 11750]|nr:hypothetical protein FS749_008554 [Ceratobasidium sp. UAMH 11750]